jgi:hypothetical protein
LIPSIVLRWADAAPGTGASVAAIQWLLIEPYSEWLRFMHKDTPPNQSVFAGANWACLRLSFSRQNSAYMH